MASFFFCCCSYGLLGPSGCGKTTLLKCIVGTLKISRGHITVLGKPPAFPGHEVPGKMVGYMPQVLQSVCFEVQKSSVAGFIVDLSWSLRPLVGDIVLMSKLLSRLLLQDLALYNEFTISDTLVFFGRIHGLTSKDTQARMDFLIDFLDLPQKSSLVRNLRLGCSLDSRSSLGCSPGLLFQVETQKRALANKCNRFLLGRCL